MRLIACAILLAGVTAWARKRPRFEPTDLDLENSGVLELDMQFGAVRGQDVGRVVVPDFEIDLGILSFIELDIDGAFAVEASPGGPLFDPLWTSVKVGL